MTECSIFCAWQAFETAGNYRFLGLDIDKNMVQRSAVTNDEPSLEKGVRSTAWLVYLGKDWLEKLGEIQVEQYANTPLQLEPINEGLFFQADEFPQLEGLVVKHWHVPFQNVPGGDFIDYFKVDDDNLVVVLGDIMGKKWGAWYFAVAYAGYVRSAIRMILDSDHDLSPSTILDKINKAIFKDERISDVFITLSVVCINSKNKILKYAGAGDLPIIYKSDSVKSVKSNGILLGFKEVGNYQNVELQLNSGEAVYLITDGIPETRMTNGDFFGEAKLKQTISEILPNADPLEKIIDVFSESTANTFEDDISIVAIKIL